MIDIDSILTSTKKRLGMTEEYEPFDDDIIMFINSVLATLTQLGVGPSRGYSIQDASAKWSEYLGDNERLNFVKDYVYLKVKLIFDPPASSTVLKAYEDMIKEYEFRITVEVESMSKEDKVEFIPYKGDYKVVSNVNGDQVLQTANKLMTEDLIVEQIPFERTENSSGGETVIIGK